MNWLGNPQVWSTQSSTDTMQSVRVVNPRIFARGGAITTLWDCYLWNLDASLPPVECAFPFLGSLRNSMLDKRMLGTLSDPSVSLKCTNADSLRTCLDLLMVCRIFPSPRQEIQGSKPKSPSQSWFSNLGMNWDHNGDDRWFGRTVLV